MENQALFAHFLQKNTFIISVLDKPLPFKGYKSQYTHITGWDDKEGNYFVSDDWSRVARCLIMISEKRPEITTVVVDDLQYILANEFMARSSERGYDKYSEMAAHYWQVIRAAQKLRPELFVFFMSHNEVDASGVSKVKTIGKLLDDKITIEGMFTIVLQTKCDDDGFWFMTQSGGASSAKSPDGMFKDLLIPNDLQLVTDAIMAYEF